MVQTFLDNPKAQLMLASLANSLNGSGVGYNERHGEGRHERHGEGRHERHGEGRHERHGEGRHVRRLILRCESALKKGMTRPETDAWVREAKTRYNIVSRISEELIPIKEPTVSFITALQQALDRYTAPLHDQSTRRLVDSLVLMGKTPQELQITWQYREHLPSLKQRQGTASLVGTDHQGNTLAYIYPNVSGNRFTAELSPNIRIEPHWESDPTLSGHRTPELAKRHITRVHLHTLTRTTEHTLAAHCAKTAQESLRTALRDAATPPTQPPPTQENPKH